MWHKQQTIIYTDSYIYIQVIYTDSYLHTSHCGINNIKTYISYSYIPYAAYPIKHHISYIYIYIYIYQRITIHAA